MVLFYFRSYDTILDKKQNNIVVYCTVIFVIMLDYFPSSYNKNIFDSLPLVSLRSCSSLVEVVQMVLLKEGISYLEIINCPNTPIDETKAEKVEILTTDNFVLILAFDPVVVKDVDTHEANLSYNYEITNKIPVTTVPPIPVEQEYKNDVQTLIDYQQALTATIQYLSSIFSEKGLVLIILNYADNKLNIQDGQIQINHQLSSANIEVKLACQFNQPLLNCDTTYADDGLVMIDDQFLTDVACRATLFIRHQLKFQKRINTLLNLKNVDQLTETLVLYSLFVKEVDTARAELESEYNYFSFFIHKCSHKCKNCETAPSSLFDLCLDCYARRRNELTAEALTEKNTPVDFLKYLSFCEHGPYGSRGSEEKLLYNFVYLCQYENEPNIFSYHNFYYICKRDCRTDVPQCCEHPMVLVELHQ
jgi:hypothetical protein